MAIARFLKQLIPSPPYPDPPRPDLPLCIVGDLHGCDVLLVQMLARFAALPDAGQLRVIFAGDLIDRGPNSAAVLNRLRALEHDPAPFAAVICLMGNHERMLLDFIADPVRNGPRWLSNGGDATLESFGLSANRPMRKTALSSVDGAPSAPLEAMRDALLTVMPSGLIEWIGARPLMWLEDELAVIHAGANPAAALDDQVEKDMLWGHREFRTRRRTDGLWIVHGHFIVAEPMVTAGRISVDTGAYHTGRLTAVRLDREGLRFIETRATDKHQPPALDGDPT